MTDLTHVPFRRAACLAAIVAVPALAQAPAAPAKPAAGSDAKGTAGSMATIDQRYVVGPTVADDFGYRVVWQTGPLATKDATFAVLNATADSAWMSDTAGSVVRIRRDNGETVWRASTFQGIERTVAIEYLPTEHADNAYVVTELGTVALDATTGNIVRRGHFSRMLTAAPAVFGPSMIYGTATGLTSWYQYASAFNWRSTTLGGRVVAPVCIAGDLAIAGSTDGTVLVMDASSAGIRWKRKLTAGVEAKAAADENALTCYVAGLDQSVWAFELGMGRVIWQYFTQSPLREAPVCIAGGLYVQIPGEGLVSFNPLPKEKPDGEVRWKSAAPGNVIARVGTNLMAWDRPTRTLTAVDVASGRPVRQVALPQVESLQFSPTIDGDLFVAGKDGRVERLETLARHSAAPATTAATGSKPAAPASPRKAPSAGATKEKEAAGADQANPSGRLSGSSANR